MDQVYRSDSEPSLFDNISNGNWELALEYLNSLKGQQEAAHWKGTRGESLLHVALNRRSPPLELVKKLVTLNPTSTSTKDLRVRFTPLHYSIFDATLEVIQYLLEVDPSAAKSQSFLLGTPLRNLVVMYVHDLRRPQSDNCKNPARNTEIFQMLLKAMYPEFHQAETFQLLHSGVTWIQSERYLTEKAAEQLMQLLVSLVPPSELTALDQFGNTPLQLACSSARTGGFRSAYGSPCVANVHKPSQFCLIAYLSRVSPASARIKNGDQLPLHTIIHRQHLCLGGIAALANAHPTGLTAIDPVFKLYPFQLAAVGNDGSLSATYFLLRKCPELDRFVFH